jgi:putative oxidoreductase
MNDLNKYHDTVYCIMRLIVGLLFASHGGQKILGFPPGGHGAPEGAMMVLGAWIELAGGLMIGLGFLTRIAAFVSSGEMAVAYFMVHAKGGFFPIVNHGESAVFYCFAFLFIFFYGSGWLSLDAMLFKKGSAAPATAAT